MPTTNRPFFANFFAAFRAQSAFQKGTPAITSTATQAAPFTTSNSPAAAPTPSQIQAYAELSDKSLAISHPTARQKSPHTATTTASAAAATTAAAAAAAHAQTHFRSSRPLHTPNGTPQNRTHSTSPLPPSRTPSQTGTSAASPPPQTVGPNPQFPYTSPYAPPRPRRGSDTSDSGAAGPGGGASPGTPAGAGGMWAGAVSAEKWYIGGRTAGGEEKFYKLGLARKYDSADRLSLDRLSL